MVDVIFNFAYTLQTFCSLDLKAIGRVEPKLVPDGEAACGDLSSINVRRPNRPMDVLLLRGKAAEGEEIKFHFELCFKSETCSINSLIGHLHVYSICLVFHLIHRKKLPRPISIIFFAIL